MSQSSQDAKDATRRMLEAEIAYLQGTIASHNAAITKDNVLAKIPFFKNTALANIAHEQAGIKVATDAIQHIQELEAHYKSIGRL